MQINVEIGEIDLNTNIGTVCVDGDEDGHNHEPYTIGDAIIAEAAKRLVAAAGREDRYRISTRIEAIRDAEIRAQTAPAIAEALSRSIQPTNSYGDPTGKATTLSEVIVKKATEALTRKPDSYGGNLNIVQTLIKAEVEKALTKELAGIIADEKAKVVAAVRAKAGELIADAVKQGLGTR